MPPSRLASPPPALAPGAHGRPHRTRPELPSPGHDGRRPHHRSTGNQANPRSEVPSEELHPKPMAEPSGAATRAGTSGTDVLPATKLYVPRPQSGFVPRPRLVTRHDEGLARGPILVCAPAGYGKTSLLADWTRGGRRPVAWLSLDASDNDPARFWRHVIAALERIKPEVAGRLRVPGNRDVLGRVVTRHRHGTR